MSQSAIDTYLAGTGASEPDEDEVAPAGLPAGTCGGSVDDKPSQLLDSDQAEDPAWSPDCSKIVYSDRGSLWTMNNDGTNRKRLTAYDGSHSDSPVPTRIAGDNGKFEFDDFPLLQKGESVTVAGYTITVTADDGDTHTVSIAKSN